ncbi:MAG: hypothetical protein K6C08_13730 [Oscillospiraceae bacterium]|nr:hypothetical protein [Oscillospiraceae bacterium]
MYYNNKKLVLSVFWVLLGAALLILSVMEVLDSAVYSAMGAALATVGALQIIRNLKYRKDPEYREKVDTQERDERCSFIRMKSWTWTGTIVILVEGIGVVAATILGNETVQLVLSYSVCLILTVYWIAYLVLSRKY